MENITTPISPGELLDKITILEIKSEQIEDAEKLNNVKLELNILNESWVQSLVQDDAINELKKELKKNNQTLWEIEDKIRIKEANKEFDEVFIELARSVYIENDKRAATKKKINLLLGSTIVEEKSYADY